MMRGALPKIVLGVVLVLLALHFTVSNVSISKEGSWSSPHFSISLGKTTDVNATPSATPVSSPVHNDKTPPTEPPSMWEDLKEEIVSTSPEAAVATDHVASSAVELEVTSTQHAGHAPTHSTVINPHANHGDESVLPCSGLPGAEDVVFIIKTGATEVPEKIPVHFNTTLRCFPKSLIFSDFGEDYEGHIIHDAIGNVVDQIKLEHEDFELWRRLHDNGRESLDPSELSFNDHGNNLGGGGNPSNGGWRLDKFKNIPMVNYTIHRYPTTSWFIYTDADTYIMWSNLLKWTQKMDPSRLTYLGSAAVIDDQIFGHGGSGYIISNALMHKAAQVYNEKQEEWDEFAATHWAGDCVLATLLEKLGAPLDWAYPMIQGGDNNVMSYFEWGYDRLLWCYPAVSYHHIPPETVASLWHFEQEWLDNSSAQINHSDVYKQWYIPQLPHERDSWDNMSEEEMPSKDIKDAWDCRDLCKHNSTCLQWSYSDAKCRFLETTRIGKASTSVHSGWMLERIDEKVKELDAECIEKKQGEWILPEPRDKVKKHIKKRRLAALAANKYVK